MNDVEAWVRWCTRENSGVWDNVCAVLIHVRRVEDAQPRKDEQCRTES